MTQEHDRLRLQRATRDLQRAREAGEIFRQAFNQRSQELYDLQARVKRLEEKLQAWDDAADWCCQGCGIHRHVEVAGNGGKGSDV